jgi:uncharacterized OB-fold protein
LEGQVSLSKRIEPAGQAYDETLAPLVDLGAPEHPGFVERGGEILLVGSQSASSGVRTYPPRSICPDTGARDMQPFMIGPNGTLYAFSEVQVSSSRPTPYMIGYVDFPQGVRVLADVRTSDPAALACDMPVILRAEGGGWFVSPFGAGVSQ